MDNAYDNTKHEVKLIDRGLIYLTGIDKIISFDSEEFLMETTMGYIILKGSELEIIKLDTYQGNVSIKGHVDDLHYTEAKEKGKEEGLFTKLFK